MSTTLPARAVRVRELAPGESLRPFIDLAWTINARDPHWVPPLRRTIEAVLDRGTHPYHRHAEVAYFLAERGGVPVGRIAASVNRLHNEYHGEQAGFFGFFEAIDDAEVASALVAAAAGWLRARGMRRLRGPMNFSTNEEGASPGVLVAGHETPPRVMMAHNPPYYGALLEAAGLAKEKDLLAYWLDDPRPPERLVKAAERAAERDGVVLRALRLRRLREEVGIIREIYNSAWSRNWGFVPMTDAEFAYIARDLKPVVDPELCLIAEVHGQPVGFSLALPDLNRALRHLPDGRLLPFGFLKLLWHRRKIDSLRVLTLGLRPEHQNQGLATLFFLRTFQVGVARGYRAGEASWILEDNLEMRSPLEKLGAQAYKTYRVYAMEL